MIQGRRTVGIPLMVVLALLGALLLAPSGGTHALWSDGQTQSLGSVSSDNIGLSASLVSAEPTLPGSSTIQVQNTSTRLDGVLSANSSVTAVGWDNELAGHVDVSYAECAGGAEIGTSAVGPGERQDLCVSATAPGSGADFLRQYAGATVQVRSELTQTAVDAPTWSANATVDTQHRVGFPRPTHPGETLRLRDVCQSPLLAGPATISWAWPDTSGRQTVDTPAVARWAIQQKVNDGWEEIVSVDRTARSATLPGGSLVGLLNTATVRVVGYPTADAQTPVVGTFEVQVSRTLDLLGIPLLVSCTSATGLP